MSAAPLDWQQAWSDWQQAWTQALYGPAGFFSTGSGPAAHFRTAVHAAGPQLAAALIRLAVDHGCSSVLDVGAGRGELLTEMADLPAGARLGLHGVDVVDRPSRLPTRIRWSAGIDRLPVDALDGALVVAWELLDDVPCPVLEVDEDGLVRQVEVYPGTGRERLGAAATDAQTAWCDRWWPLDGDETGSRAEVGLPRDQLWADLVARAAATRHGAVLLAVDYAHALADRPLDGSLTGFRRGRAVPPIPDCSCDVTAHVALDAVAAAGERAGARTLRFTDQRTALLALGIDQVGELLDPGSLGGFGWLLQLVEGRSIQRSGPAPARA